MNDVAAFARLIEVLRPWLPRVVVVGGWAHRLHRLHPAADPPTHMPIVTRDVDLALCPTPPLEGDIGAALRAADFHLELTGDCEPPVAEYRLRDDSQAFYAEFLTPLRGRGDLRG